MLNKDDYAILMSEVKVAELTLTDIIEKIAKDDGINQDTLDDILERVTAQMQSIKNSIEYCKTH